MSRCGGKIQEKDDDAKLREQYIAQVTRSLNEVQDNLTDLTRKQQDRSRQYVGMIEEQKQVSDSQREDLMRKIQSLRNEPAATSAALARARKQAEGDDRARVTELVQLVEKLQAEVEARNRENEVLHATVASLQLDLQRREQLIVAQRSAISESNEIIERQARKNTELALEQYRVFYRIDTYNRLSADRIIQHRGGGVWSLSTSGFDETRLKEAHKSGLTEIRINKPLPRLKLVTIHDRHSYEMVPLSRAETMFRILHRDRFWAAGRHLVIAVK